MSCLPSRFATVILSFAPLFPQRSWRHAEVLLTGAILVPGQRTVTSILHSIMPQTGATVCKLPPRAEPAAWCPQAASRTLLNLLLAACAPKGPIVPGVNDTIERRRGKRITAKGIYRDQVRSSHRHFTQGERPTLAQPQAAGSSLVGEDGQGSDRVAGGTPSEVRVPADHDR